MPRLRFLRPSTELGLEKRGIHPPIWPFIGRFYYLRLFAWLLPALISASLKTDGTVGIPDYREKRPFQVLAYNAQTINQSGYISEDGNYWHIISTEDNRVETELEENTAYAVYNSMGDSLRILQNGRIEVGFSESGMLTALSEGEGYH